MRQLSQNMRTGVLRIEDAPCPALLPGGVLVRNAYSLISAGTERHKLEMGRKSLLGKARARPDLVRKVLKKVRTEGLLKTMQAVRARLDAPSALGYSCAGVVAESADGAGEFAPGDRVACGGANYAVHAEMVWAPRNLCVRVPDGVDLRAASLTTVGAIALQGVRQADARLGETIVVVGLGLVGQIACQLLSAAGCRVVGVDLDGRMVEMARRGGLRHGIDGRGGDVAGRVLELTGGAGADATLLCAATGSNGPIEMAAEMTRDRGRVVVVGVVGMTLPREPYYMKEIELRLSRSYGPGRYDPAYEEKGRDYPRGEVRWTERRNMECFLEMVGRGLVRTDHILTHNFCFERAVEAYDLLGQREEAYLGISLEYAAATGGSGGEKAPGAAGGGVGVGLIGAGNYAQANLLPVLREMAGARLAVVSDAQGLVAEGARGRYGFGRTAASAEAVLGEGGVEWAVIATRHDTHASLAARALAAGKHVHVEKPLALSEGELAAVRAAHAGSGRHLTVGFNRRFAPATRAALEFLSGSGARTVSIRVNAGRLEPGHWLLDPDVGGGRLLGEGCHFIDLACLLAGGAPTQVYAVAARSSARAQAPRDFEDVAVALRFADGSSASVVYCSAGDPSLPKERIEVASAGRRAVIDDFRSVALSAGGRTTKRTWRPQDKGQRAMLEAELRAIGAGGGDSPISWESLETTTRASLAVIESLRTGCAVDMASPAACRAGS